MSLMCLKNQIVGVCHLRVWKTKTLAYVTYVSKKPNRWSMSLMCLKKQNIGMSHMCLKTKPLKCVTYVSKNENFGMCHLYV